VLTVKSLAYATAARTVKLLDVSTDQSRSLTGHAGQVNSVAFSPDGKILASASSDNSVRLWEVSTNQPVGQPLTGHTDAVLSVALSPDGKMLASAGSDKTVRLWDVSAVGWIELACRIANRNQSLSEWVAFVGADQPYLRTCPDRPSGMGAPADAPKSDNRVAR
jgi:WD40 repeat protein